MQSLLKCGSEYYLDYAIEHKFQPKALEFMVDTGLSIRQLIHSVALSILFAGVGVFLGYYFAAAAFFCLANLETMGVAGMHVYYAQKLIRESRRPYHITAV